MAIVLVEHCRASQLVQSERNLVLHLERSKGREPMKEGFQVRCMRCRDRALRSGMNANGTNGDDGEQAVDVHGAAPLLNLKGRDISSADRLAGKPFL